MNTVELALRIKKLRTNQKMTLAKLATSADLTESMMSKIENFRVTPSLPAISAIASALNTTLSELFEGLDQKPKLSIVRAKQRRQIQRDESPWKYFSLTSQKVSKKIDPFIVEIPPGDQRKLGDAHEGEEFMLMLEGDLDFIYGDQTHHLRIGDATYSDGNIKHNLINSSSAVAKILVVYCHPNIDNEK